MILDEINLQPIPNQEIYYQSFRIRIYQTNSAMAMDLYKEDIAIVLGLRLVNGGLAIPYPALTSDVEGGTSGINFLLDCPDDGLPDYKRFGTDQKLYAFNVADLAEFDGDVFTPANDIGEFGGIDMFKPSPVLSYDFSTMLTLHSDWSLTRASAAVYYDVNGDVQTVGNNMPRFTSFETGGPQAGILIEGSSGNLVERSFYGTGWATAGTVTNNFANTNFPGLQSLKLECTSNGTIYYGRWGGISAINYTQGYYYIASVFFRPGINNSPQSVLFQVMAHGANTTSGIRFNPATMEVNQEIGNLTAYKIKPLPNGVYKLIIVTQADATDTGSGPELSVATGSGQLAGDYFECWGFQLEEINTISNVRNGASAPITTTGSAISRPYDNLRITNGVFDKYMNIDNFSIYTDFFCDVLSTSTYISAVRLYRTSSEQLLIRIARTPSIWNVGFHRITPAISGSAITISPNMPISTLPNHFKVATTVRNGNEISIAVNGMVFHGVMPAAILPATTYQLQLASQYSLSTTIYKKVDYYDTALSNEVLQQMTGL